MGADLNDKKIVVTGGSAGMGRQAAFDVLARGSSAVLCQDRGIAGEVTDRSAVTGVQRALSEYHSDTTLMAAS